MKKFYVFLLFVVALTYQTSFYIQANENNLIGTLSILKPEFYPTSPLHGAVAWQQEWVMRLYDLGWDRDKSTGKLIIEDEQPPALIKIIDRLFHRPPETTGMMDFGPVKDIRDQAAADVAQTLGEIIAVLPELISKEVGSKFNRLKELAEQLKAGAKIEKIKAAASSLCEVSDAEFFEKLAESKKALQNVKIPEKAISAIEFKKLINEFCEFKESCGKLVRGADTAQLLRQAFSQNPQETLLTLLALLWASSESNRDDLAKYYQALDEKIREVKNTSIFLKDQAPGWQAWIADKLDPKLKDQMIADLQLLKGKLEDTPKLYEALVYLVLMPGNYPKISEYKTATLWLDGTEHLNVTFADCMDSSMMNFLLILAYDKETKNFNVDFLKQRLELSTLNEKLEQFLKGDHPAFIRKIKDKEDSKIDLTPQTVEEIEIHNAWTDVESNIPGVAYNKCLSGKSIEQCHGLSKGFIVATEQMDEPAKKRAASSQIGVDTSSLKQAGYEIVAPTEGICFELQPSLKNFIVLFNYLLNLGLFDPNKVYDEILKSDFVKVYLPRLAEKLKIEIKPSVPLDKVDEKDYGEQILTKLGFYDEFPFELSTSHGHGEIIKKYNIFTKELKNMLDRLPMSSTLLTSFRGIKLGNMGDGDIRTGKFVSNGMCNFYDLPWFDISTSFAITGILNGIDKTQAKCSPEVLRYFMRLTKIQPDLAVRLEIFEQIVLMVAKGQGYAEAIYAEAIASASECVKNANYRVRQSAIILFRTLVENGQGYQEAVAAASKGVGDVSDGDSSERVRQSAIRLFEALFEKRKGYPDAISIALNGIEDVLWNVRSTAEDLFDALLKNGQGYPEVRAALLKCLESTDKMVRITGLRLLHNLWKKGGIQQSKMAAIIKGMQDKAEAQKFFDDINGKLKDTKIKEDLERYFSQP